MTAERLSWRAGFELELLAPRGASRRTLAAELSARYGGSVRAVWHEDSEPTPVPGLGGRFLHLTQGFEVIDGNGVSMCSLVDDITIRAELDANAPARSPWTRILTDEPRLLRLLEQRCDPAAPLESLLDPVAELFGETPQVIGKVVRLDTRGATVALATGAGGARERPCEIVTPPLVDGHLEILASLLEPARSLGFSVPVEAAVHIHYDAAPFRDPAAMANLIRLFADCREQLWAALGTNPNCRRLAPLPEPLILAARGRPTLDELRLAASGGGLSKFYDVNLANVLCPNPIRDTVEVRILPGSLDAAGVVKQAAIVERLLDRCLDPTPIETTEDPVRKASTHSS
jgi:hypothetical protein